VETMLAFLFLSPLCMEECETCGQNFCDVCGGCECEGNECSCSADAGDDDEMVLDEEL